MANMEDCRTSLTDLEHGNSPDLVAEVVRFALREQDKREERLAVLDSARGIGSTKGGSLEKIVREPTLSQGGRI
jgi:hypothetical protein